MSQVISFHTVEFGTMLCQPSEKFCRNGKQTIITVREDFWIEIDQDSDFNNLFSEMQHTIFQSSLCMFLKPDYSAEVAAISAVPAQSMSSSALTRNCPKSVCLMGRDFLPSV